VIGSIIQLFEIGKSFRMPKSDLQGRPIYYRKHDCIAARPTIVCAALAESRRIEARTVWSTTKFVRAARRCRITQIQAGQHVITASAPLTDDLRQALDATDHDNGLAHQDGSTRCNGDSND
jgi:hypothetical protein